MWFQRLSRTTRYHGFPGGVHMVSWPNRASRRAAHQRCCCRRIWVASQGFFVCLQPLAHGVAFTPGETSACSRALRAALHCASGGRPHWRCILLSYPPGSLWIFPVLNPGQLNDQTQGIVRRLLARKGLGYVRFQQHEVGAGTIPFEILSADPAPEQLSEIIFRPEIIRPISTNFFLHKLVSRSASADVR